MNRILLIFIIALVIASCNKGERTNKIEVNELNKNEVFLDFYFPDTVEVGKTYNGKILYQSHHDSITTKLFEEGDTSRILALYLKTNKDVIGIGYEKVLSSVEKDTFVPYKNDSIPFALNFTSYGINYIEGVLEDKVYLQETDTSELRIISNHHYITLPVYVDKDKRHEDNPLKKHKISIMAKKDL